MDWSKKWEGLGCSSSDDEADLTPAAELGLRLLTDWLREANPGLSRQQLDALLSFFDAQQPPLGQPELSRAPAVIAWEEAHGGVAAAPLLEAVWASRLRASEDAAEDARFVRLRGALTSALNTAEACAACGGARTLFERLAKEPEAELAEKYRSCRFAREALARRAEADVRHRPVCASAAHEERPGLPGTNALPRAATHEAAVFGHGTKRTRNILIFGAAVFLGYLAVLVRPLDGENIAASESG
ncbi:hypothetical protein AB1Y20_010798 [Prymnesium parvum]|uniref:Uncharacterized protein n=1 Tax=Prymnesium parvum TaxID=97485 RepID=A0AB34ISC4_PRYPA